MPFLGALTLAAAIERSAVLRLVGDPERLSAVAGGGALRLLVNEVLVRPS